MCASTQRMLHGSPSRGGTATGADESVMPAVIARERATGPGVGPSRLQLGRDLRAAPAADELQDRGDSQGDGCREDEQQAP